VNCCAIGIDGKGDEKEEEEERDYVISSYITYQIFPDFIGF